MSDYLSLTLPKATARAKRRFRKPKRPSFWTLWYAAFCVYCGVWGIAEYLNGHLITATWSILGCGLYWRDAVVSYRTGRRATGFDPVALAWVAAGIVLIATGTP